VGWFEMMLLIPGPRLLLLLGFLLQFQLAISPFALFYFILFHYFCRFSLPLSVFVCWRRMLALLFSIFYFPFSIFHFPFLFWPCLFVSAGAPLWFPLIYFRFQVISASTQHFMAVFAWFWSFTFFLALFLLHFKQNSQCKHLSFAGLVPGVFLVVSFCTFAWLLICGA